MSFSEEDSVKKIILHGGGEHARVVLDCLQDQGKNVIGIFDPKFKGDLFGVPQLGSYDGSWEPNAFAIVAIGDNVLRKKVALKTTHRFCNAIHTSAILSGRMKIGTGNMILHRTTLQAQVSIGNHVIVNTAAQIDHDCIIEDFVHIGPGTVICGAVKIGEGSFLGAGSVVIQGKTIGRWATVGAGAVVTKDVPDYAVVVGNPARIIKYNNP